MDRIDDEQNPSSGWDARGEENQIIKPMGKFFTFIEKEC